MTGLIAGVVASCALVWAACPAAAQEVQTYLYDVHGRLAGAPVARSSSPLIGGYQFDPADNRLRRSDYAMTAPALAHRMTHGEILVPTQLMRSRDARFTLVLQQDGNLVLYFGAAPLWATATATGRSLYFQMQTDGNAVLYDAAYAPIWASGTSGYPGATLTLEDDGDLVLRDAAYMVRWRTGTGGH